MYFPWAGGQLISRWPRLIHIQVVLEIGRAPGSLKVEVLQGCCLGDKEGEEVNV